MKKMCTAFICVVYVTLLSVVSSTALFTDIESTGTYALSIGTLDVDMNCTDAGGNTPFSLFDDEDIPWVPGDIRGSIIMVKNSGTLDARWRLGIVPDAGSSDIMGDEIVLSFYREDGSGNWQLIRSDTIQNFVVTNNEDRWIYDKDLTGEREFSALPAGESQDMLMVVDFELSAQAPVQEEYFFGKILLQGTQVTEDAWFPLADIPLDIEGGGI